MTSSGLASAFRRPLSPEPGEWRQAQSGGNARFAHLRLQRLAAVDRDALAGDPAPGLRAEGGDGFYAGYFRDLDGHKLDVFTYS